ncbi:MAG: 2-phospho-L-lactate transferase [Spongiibacteraceae bacterium]
MFSKKVLAISGGVGGAKLVRGLAGVLPPEQLCIAANTADDFDYWGQRICPDLDSNMYALADLNDIDRGWGLKDESWRTLETMSALGGDDWFQIGDKDLATHLQRTQLLAAGKSLSEATTLLCAALGIRHSLLPMCEQPVATQLQTDEGELAFQRYFVEQQCRPIISSIRFAGVEQAEVNPAVLGWLADADLGAIIICPSNPFLSVDPMLSLPGFRQALIDSPAPVIAVSPIVGGRAIKGPAAKIMTELNMPSTAAAVAAYYGELLDGFVIDQQDIAQRESIAELGVEVAAFPSIMTDISSKIQLARDILAFVNTGIAGK